MSKKLGVIQSSYIPWKGYFDIVRSVDEFILLDDVQFSKGSWRNRNVIKAQNGPQWLTIPIDVKGKLTQNICDAQVSPKNNNWTRKHWGSIEAAYLKTRYFREYSGTFRDIYKNLTETNLSKINHIFLTTLCDILEIKTKITWSMDYHILDEKNERLIDLCKKTGSTFYLSGPAAKDYMDLALFEKSGIQVKFADYSGYPEYTQLFPPFEHAVSVLDLIFNEGPNALQYMKLLT